MNRTMSTVAVALAGMLILSVLAPVSVAAAADDTSDLSVTVSDAEDPVVTVTHNDTAVTDATVDVSLDENESDENASYEGVGEYTTDENGTAALPAPSEDVTIVITVTADNASASTTVELDASDDDDEGKENAFGQLLSQFIQENKDDVDGPFGLAVAEFVHEHNPGNAPDHAGPPEDAGGNQSTQGQPDHAGTDDEQGPPDHAGGPDDADDDDEEDADDTTEADSDDSDDDDADE